MATLLAGPADSRGRVEAAKPIQASLLEPCPHAGSPSLSTTVQRYKVNPMPRISRQAFIWRPGTKLVDLNCGWYAQLAVVDYHYMNTIVPGGHGQPGLEKRRGGNPIGHLSYSGGKHLLPYTPGIKSYGFDPEGGQGGHQSAISTRLQKPNSPQAWKQALQQFGPLIVSKALHFVVVVGVTKRSFYYLDSLTGQAAYHDYPLMQYLVNDVYYVDVGEVKRLFGMP